MKYLNKYKSPLFLVIVVLLVFFGLILVDRFFKVKKIEIISDRNYTLADENDLMNDNLLLLNKDKLSKKIVDENYLVSKADVSIVWPSTLKIRLDFYEPLASLIVNDGYFDLTADGRILAKKKDMKPVMPVINYYQKLNSGSYETGDWINFKDVNQALFFLSKLEEIGFTPLTIDIGGEDMLVFNLNNGRRFIFSINKDRNVQDYQLELIVRQFKIEGKEFKKIDLRFNKPVVGF